METIETTRLKLQTGTEIATRVYCIDEVLHKLVKVYDLPDYEEEKKEFLNLMAYLEDDIYFKELVKPQSILRVEEYGEVRYGYTMEYLMNHMTLEEAVFAEPLKVKKNYYYSIAEVLKKLHRINMAYDDIHNNNIMVDRETHKLKFIDPDSVKVFGINTNDIDESEKKEKLKFTEMVLTGLYDADLSFNYYRHLSDKLKKLQVTPELREYVEEIEQEKNPEGFITDSKEDMSKDIIRFNKKIITRRGL